MESVSPEFRKQVIDNNVDGLIADLQRVKAEGKVAHQQVNFMMHTLLVIWEYACDDKPLGNNPLGVGN